jgi:alpha(1,3/1,4) fucosyltransferase
MKTIHVVNYPDVSDSAFYEINSYYDERRRFEISIREEIQKYYQFKIDNICDNVEPSSVILSLRSHEKACPVLKNIKNHEKNKCFLFYVEPFHLSAAQFLYSEEAKNIFGTMFITFDNLVDNQTYFKTYHQQPREKRIDNIPDFSHKKFCMMIQSNYEKKLFPHHVILPEFSLYEERAKAASFFAQMGEFDLFGRFWDENPAWKLRNRTIPDKLPIMKHYKFCICYENMHSQPGYITERIFECMYAGSVPIYLGAPNITDYVPKECFIDRRAFDSNQDLYQFLRQIDCKTYGSYIEAAIQFLETPEAKRFSARNVAQEVVKKIRQIIDEPILCRHPLSQ